MSEKNGQFNLELFFSALADRTRLRLLNLMGEDEVCVCFFVESLNINQPKISRHLAYLKRAGIVDTRKEGLWIHYRVVKTEDEGLNKILSDIRGHLATDPEMQADRERLVSVCCSAESPAGVQGAPIPASLAGYKCDTTCRD